MRSFTGESFWARGFYVSTVGLNEDGVKKYILEQEAEDSRLAQLVLVDDETPPLGGHDERPLGGLTRICSRLCQESFDKGASTVVLK
jgi:hypothetical protein